MIITISDLAKQHLLADNPAGLFRLGITDGCCGKSFLFEHNPEDTSDLIEVDTIRFAADDETQQLAPEVHIDYPGPIEGYMITNLKAVGGCACGRSFFIDE